ncbi:MAG TPA: threonine synthase [Gemmatimonadaceae bacterium]|nr:threonine synthase [Gemmatimonadaceae bacterium]
MTTWILQCSACGREEPQGAPVGLCGQCGQPYLARFTSPAPGRDSLCGRWDLWRYAPALPLAPLEEPVSLGEGATPLIPAPGLAKRIGVRQLWIKDEAVNPTASFKARGLAAAVTRARARGVPGLCVPTAGNAGAALAAYGAAAGVAVRVYAPATTPRPILHTVQALGADLVTVDGHIGDAGRLCAEFSRESGYFNVATLREPYRVEGNKTLGLEIAEQLGWRLPDVVVYPTGGGEGVIGIWKAFEEMRAWGWVDASAPPPAMVVAQASGCAPLVRAQKQGADRATPWENPTTHAAGLRVPGPLGDRLVLRALRESGGAAADASEEEIRAATAELAGSTGIDAAPEGGCALAVAARLARSGEIRADAEVVLYNTGSGASYRT